MLNKFLVTFGAAILAFHVMAADKPPDVSKLPAPAKKAGLTYAKDIKPIFDETCVKCHGAEKQKGKYRVDTLEAAVKGGSSDEAAVVPGKSDKSPLVHYVGYLIEDMEMPPLDKDGKPQKLSDDKIALIRAWIDQGAK